jgi:hypothetical protein
VRPVIPSIGVSFLQVRKGEGRNKEENGDRVPSTIEVVNYLQLFHILVSQLISEWKYRYTKIRIERGNSYQNNEETFG